MRLVVLISPVDAKLAPDFTAALQAAGPYERHQLLIIPTPSQVQVANKMLEALGPLFEKSKVVATAEENFDVWPKGANYHFAEATSIWFRETDQIPVFLMELDCYPRGPGWLDTFAHLHHQLGLNARYIGKCVPFAQVNPAIPNSPILEHPTDKVMLGCAIYPHNTFADPNAVVEIRQLHMSWRLFPEPYDHFLRFCWLRTGRTETDLIADQWNTQNHRIENGELICDPAPKTTQFARDRGGKVDPRAVVIHGCKDGSGHRLCAAGAIPAAASMQAALPVWEQMPGALPPAPTTTQLAATVAQLAAGQNAIQAAMAQMMQFMMASQTATMSTHSNKEAERTVDVKVPVIEGHDGIGFPGEPRPTGISTPQFDAFLGTASHSVKEVAGHFGVEQDDILKMVEGQPQYKISGDRAKWIKLVTAEVLA